RPIAGVQLSTTAYVVRLRALEQGVELAHHRIDRARFDAAPLCQLRFGVLQVTTTSVSHPELIVRGRRPRVECERLFEMDDRSRIISLRQRDATGAEMRRRRIGLEEDRLIEQRACGTRSSLREIGVAEPDEGCDIVR